MKSQRTIRDESSVSISTPHYSGAGQFFSPVAPKYYRVNWEGVDLPRRPSLKLKDDERFFELIGSNPPIQLHGAKDPTSIDERNSSKTPKTPSRAGKKLRNSWRKKKNEKTETKAATQTPIHVRKLEIELVQRRLPRYPSQTHLPEPTFYPLASSEPIVQKPYIQLNVESLHHPTEETGENSYMEIGDSSESYEEVIVNDDYYEEEEETIEDDYFPSNMEEEAFGTIRDAPSPYTEIIIKKESCDLDKNQKDMKEEIDETVGMDESSYTSYNNDSSSFGLVESNPEEEPHYEPRVGVVPLSIHSMILQARMEMRSRKVPPEHKRKFKTPLGEALEVAQCTKLNEHSIEAYGKQIEKYKATELPSATWRKGQETVLLPNFCEPNPEQFTIFQEAVALGGIKALKPEITTNYKDRQAVASFQEEEVDVDDSTKPKYMRTKYLTDQYLHQEQYMKADDDNDEISFVRYKSLDEVILPTTRCPVIAPATSTLTNIELKEALSRQVAEKVWERRYRLERPRAQQRITIRCNCKYCETSSPYQTFAYRKQWLIEQDLWKEPDCPSESAIILAFESTTENHQHTSNDTNKMLHRGDEDFSDGVNLDESETDSFAMDDLDEVENEKSAEKRQHHLSNDVVRRIRNQKVKQQKPFIKRAQSILGLSRHSKHSTDRRLGNGKLKRSGLLHNSMHSMRSLFGNSSRPSKPGAT